MMGNFLRRSAWLIPDGKPAMLEMGSLGLGGADLRRLLSLALGMLFTSLLEQMLKERPGGGKSQ